MSSTRQLAAILFTDIAGYTAMMQENEAVALGVVRHYMSVLGEIVTRHNGTIVNDYGDGNLCTFPSATDAVRSALELQRSLQSEPKVPLRIGLHIGEVFFENSKLLGDGVNIASRIQSIGVANSILFSAEIYSKISNQAEFKSTSLGTFHFKNVGAAMEVFALANEGLVVPARENMEGKLNPDGSPEDSHKVSQELQGDRSKKRKRNLAVVSLIGLALAALVYSNYEKWLPEPELKSIAVLPFKSLSADPNDQYLADGFYEEIINQLSMQNQLLVISKPSSDQVVMAGMSSSDISKKLNVRYLLSGSVRKDGDNLRITTRLEDATTGRIVNSKTLDRKLDDYFNMQGEVALRVVGDVGITVSEGLVGPASTSNLKAFEYFSQSTNPGNDRILMLKKALEEDSTYLQAWLTLVNIHFFNFGNFGDSSQLKEGLAAKLRIESIDKHGYSARNANMLYSYWVLGDYRQVIRQANELLKIIPNSNPTMQRRGLAHRRLGEYQEFINDFSQVLRRNPLNFNFNSEMAATLGDFGQTREGRRYVAELRRTIPGGGPWSVYRYYKSSYNYLIMENRMDKLDSLAAEWSKEPDQNLTEQEKQELMLVKNAVVSFYQRDYTALLVPLRTRDDAPLDARFTFDSAMSYRLSGDSLRSNALFLRAKRLYEAAASKATAGSLEALKINLDYAITLAALGEPGWEKLGAKIKQGLIPLYQSQYYQRFTVACIMAGRKKEAMRLLNEWKERNIPFATDGYIKPFWPLLKNNPLLDPLRSEPGFEELWDGNHLKLKPLKVPVD